MNEFLEQFLSESRDLVEQATADLLALEERPTERDRLDSVFRGFHTLKGAAGIMDYEPMVRALHAAEDLLSIARGARAGLSPMSVGDCLAVLDQVLQWLDALEAGGVLPADAEQAANGLVRRLGQAAPSAAPPDAKARQEHWQAALLARHAGLAGQAAYALRYVPGPSAYFEGLDPIDELQRLGGLLALDITAAADLPDLERLDPFQSLTAFELLLGEAPAPEAIAALRRPDATAELVPLAEQTAVSALELTPRAVELIHAQILMLRTASGEGREGRTGSAVRVAANVLRHAGLDTEAERLAGFVLRAPSDDTEAFAVALQKLLAGALDTTPVDEAATASAPDAIVRSLRVDVERVDALVNIAGELLVAKNAFGHAALSAENGGDPRELARTLRLQHAQLERLVSDLQRSVLNLRVLPMRQVFQRFPRIIREMVATLGKPTRLITEGDAAEADKSIVEGLFEPLLHVLRNAMDHGVESIAERAAAGKPPSATITMRARREGDRIVVEVEDDGRGFDTERIRGVAAERGVADVETLRTMSDEQVADLVFAAGFSTARQVSDISGRGVGMDAVRSAVERMGGRVGLETRRGHGTLVHLSLPFTIVMTRVLTVEAAGQMFGIPLDAVVETLRLPAQDIRPIGTAHAFVLRGRTLPLIELAGVLETAPPAELGAEVFVVVAQAGQQMAGLAVDRLGDRLEVMLKPMDGLLADTPGVTGATLLGDGRVLLVLDLPELLG